MLVTRSQIGQKSCRQPSDNLLTTFWQPCKNHQFLLTVEGLPVREPSRTIISKAIFTFFKHEKVVKRLSRVVRSGIWVVKSPKYSEKVTQTNCILLVLAVKGCCRGPPVSLTTFRQPSDNLLTCTNKPFLLAVEGLPVREPSRTII